MLTLTSMIAALMVIATPGPDVLNSQAIGGTLAVVVYCAREGSRSRLRERLVGQGQPADCGARFAAWLQRTSGVLIFGLATRIAFVEGQRG